MIELSTVAPLRGPRPKGATRANRRVSGTGTRTGSRRAVLRSAAAAGAALGLSALGVFPPARRAIADGFRLPPGDLTYGRYEISDRCPGYAGRHDCSPGCGPAVVCLDCCRTSGTMTGYHHSRTTRRGFRLRPDQCWGSYDGWLWRYAGRCGRCTGGVLYRCHDGWKRSRSGHWYKTVCRWVLDCRRSAAAEPRP